jgi:hypothetical protein
LARPTTHKLVSCEGDCPMPTSIDPMPAALFGHSPVPPPEMLPAASTCCVPVLEEPLVHRITSRKRLADRDSCQPEPSPKKSVASSRRARLCPRRNRWSEVRLLVAPGQQSRWCTRSRPTKGWQTETVASQSRRQKRGVASCRSQRRCLLQPTLSCAVRHPSGRGCLAWIPRSCTRSPRAIPLSRTRRLLGRSSTQHTERRPRAQHRGGVT